MSVPRFKLLCLLVLLFNTQIASAFEFRLETGLNYEYLSPHSTYGSWKNTFVRLYHNPVEGFTYFVEGNAFWRDKEGNAASGAIGAYKDWSNWLYTYSSISFGSTSSYLPEFRFDHEFNFKIGKEKNIVPSMGLTYIKYHDVHKDYMIYPGITYYGSGFILTYKHFFNRSDPGSVSSSSDLISIGIGEEGKSWTYLDFSYGKQAYLATYLLSPQAVKQNSLNLSLTRRQWIKKDFGIFGGISYFKLQDGYEKYGFTFGFFKDF